MSELVSVIIPTYKRSDNLNKALQSVLNQTYENVEIIVIDDNNPDTKYRKETERLMKAYEKNNKVIYIKHEKNKNGAVARNTGIRASKGKYIGFLDDDDEFIHDKLEKQVKFLEDNKEYDCVGSQICKGGKIQKQKIIEKNLIRDILTLKVSPITSSLLFTENSIKKINGFDESYRRHQDVELMIRYLQKYRTAYIDEPLIIMGINNGENQLNGEKLDLLKKQFLTQFGDIIEKLDAQKRGTKRKIYCSHYVSRAINHLKNKNIKLLKNVLKQAYTTYPITFTIYFIKYIVCKICRSMKWRISNVKNKKKFE